MAEGHPANSEYALAPARLTVRALIAEEEESRATLLVNPTNVAARTAYLSWGWHTIGTLKPFPDSPTYESMVIDLPLA